MLQAVGIVDSSLRTVGVFADLEELLEERTRLAEVEGTEEGAGEGRTAWELTEEERELLSRPGDAGAAGEEEEARRFVRGVVFYLRQARVVGVLLWNLPDRLQLARQASVSLPAVVAGSTVSNVRRLFTGAGTRRVRGPERGGEAVYIV